jgi:Mlc titration factor MtfA (ptsG expression regulator)
MLEVFVILVFLGVASWLLFRRKKADVPATFPERWHQILNEKVVYYHNLPKPQQQVFGRTILNFLAYVRITGVRCEVDITDKLLVASSAVIPIFGFPEWEYTFLDEVILYPSYFDRDFQTDSRSEQILGMVGSGALEGKMILSKKSLHHGFSNDRDKKNVGIHEFIHLIDKQDGKIDGLATVLNDRPFAIPWLDLIAKKVDGMRSGDIGINPYGALNRQEFLAVTGEYFFERPHLLKKRHPELFSMLSKVFNQDPGGVITGHKRKKKEIGRNDHCPCGSGKKFKRCCLAKSAS